MKKGKRGSEFLSEKSNQLQIGINTINKHIQLLKDGIYIYIYMYVYVYIYSKNI